MGEAANATGEAANARGEAANATGEAANAMGEAANAMVVGQFEMLERLGIPTCVRARAR